MVQYFYSWFPAQGFLGTISIFPQDGNRDLKQIATAGADTAARSK